MLSGEVIFGTLLSTAVCYFPVLVVIKSMRMIKNRKIKEIEKFQSMSDVDKQKELDRRFKRGITTMRQCPACGFVVPTSAIKNAKKPKKSLCAGCNLMTYDQFIPKRDLAQEQNNEMPLSVS